MRKHELLTEHERRQLLSLPDDRDGLARLYTFEPDDLDLIRDRREDHNKLGFALQLCTLRHPGVPMARNPRLDPGFDGFLRGRADRRST